MSLNKNFWAFLQMSLLYFFTGCNTNHCWVCDGVLNDIQTRWMIPAEWMYCRKEDRFQCRMKQQEIRHSYCFMASQQPQTVNKQPRLQVIVSNILHIFQQSTLGTKSCNKSKHLKTIQAHDIYIKLAKFLRLNRGFHFISSENRWLYID